MLGWNDVEVGVGQDVPGQKVQSHQSINQSIDFDDAVYVLMYC